MPPPTSYTEKTLAEYMATVLGTLGTQVLGFTVGNDNAGDYAEAVYDVMLEGGWTAMSQATDMRKVRAYACYYAWKLAQSAAGALVSFSADGASYSLEEINANIERNLGMAFSNCASFGLKDYAVNHATVKDRSDPFYFPPVG